MDSETSNSCLLMTTMILCGNHRSRLLYDCCQYSNVMILWKALGVSSWPTFAVVALNGKLNAQIAGNGHCKDLDDLVEVALQYYGRRKMLDNSPLLFSLEKDNDPCLFTSPSKCAGKLAVNVLNNRLFISNSGNRPGWELYCPNWKHKRGSFL